MVHREFEGEILSYFLVLCHNLLCSTDCNTVIKINYYYQSEELGQTCIQGRFVIAVYATLLYCVQSGARKLKKNTGK